MGCNTPHALELPLKLSAPAGAEYPDVSQFQGNVDWAAVASWQRSHGWGTASIFKMGEYTLDPEAVRNSSGTARFAFRAGYWFVRNTGCAHEASLIIWAAKRFGLKIVVLDTEVPEARGYAACLAPPIRRAGLIVIQYTSPGSNPDSSNPGLDEWVAAFGPSHVPCVWVCSVGQLDRQTIVGWQFTDGRFGPVVHVPGVSGTVDVSADYGITGLGTPKPDPYALFSKTRFAFVHGTVKAAEYNTVKTWDSAKCRNPVRRAVCESSHFHLELLAGRDYFVATHTADLKRIARPPRWGFPNKQQPLGSRFHALEARLHEH